MDISKFNFQEIFSNQDGKSSGSGFSGVIGFIIASFCFLLGVIDKMFISHSTDIMTNSLVYLSLAAGLLGVRKWVNSKTTSNEDNQIDTPENG
jgi:hypothetical protein